MSSNDERDWPLGEVLEGARNRLLLSRKEVARQAGISDTLLQTYERGYELRRGIRFDANPSPEKVAAVARVLQLDVVETLGLAGLSVRGNPNQEHDTEEAYLGLEAYFDALKRTKGTEAARAAVNRLYAVLNAAPNAAPDRDTG
ncbi:multiprotein-bridging factor 1 family protein [Lentzea sp. NPDC102401]|uniref:helix-turn-helix domain-containing protein n=1 Tax=Lentzea sp. NPDC102401 TaxID=3364128 RepID=UPI0038099EC2